MDSTVGILVICGVFGLVGAFIAKRKGRNQWEGFALGFFLNMIGIIIEASLSTNQSVLDDRLVKKGKTTFGNWVFRIVLALISLGIIILVISILVTSSQLH